MGSKKYLGETLVETLEGTPFEGWTPNDWALHFIYMYGQIDGAHHKQWVLDQIARILHGTTIKVVLAKWDNGLSEYRVSTVEPPSPAYLKWVECYKHGGEYDYDEGIAP